ncbi:maleylpyruvate isomerase family mycothiol-dependent enzyme [Nocardia wallacei]|uniref:maleylpyruvate isomerase family mycothiol-dependent enzyme n=1 Tax=Nocardia wallacei TaxID=480035 RepID=UPI002457C8B3|nr:maleylpyruvate isomerase family mycothiol-dependent enzyme [Nocardia wallacei]
MTVLDTAARRDALLSETDLLADLYLSADPATPVPTCPDWTLANLVAHVGRATRWAAATIAARTTAPIDIREVPGIRRPHDPDEAARWLRGGARAMLDNLATTGDDTPVWTTTGTVRPAAWWVRRLLHEATVHRADATLALGREFVLAPALAADGLSEFLGVVAWVPHLGTALDEGTSLRLQAHDTDDTWTIHRSGDRITFTDSGAPATLTLRGTATDLFLLLLRRIPAGTAGLDTSGDLAVLTAWLERVRF